MSNGLLWSRASEEKNKKQKKNGGVVESGCEDAQMTDLNFGTKVGGAA